ncbi:MAG TPA: cation:proton antiporter, partial [Tenuifilaceae bacterium]|nr:cation:proton antiporter [Tenuifilaceae bacterium]
MEVVYGHALLLFSTLLFAAIIASKTSGRLGVPALILFMGIGVIVGSEGLGLIHFNNFKMTQTIGVVALSIILFSGGLDTRWASVKPVMWKGISLATLGVVGTAFTTGLLVYAFTSLSFLEGLLLGSIVASTDAAAVFSVLRSKNIELKHNLRPVLEFESGSNDPMAYMLTLVFTMMISGGELSGFDLTLFLAAQLTVGSLVGIFMGKAMVWITNRIHLTNDGLYSVM